MYAKQARIKALRSVKSSESACVSGTASAGERKRRREQRANRFIFSLGNIHQNSRMNMEFSCCRHEALSHTFPSLSLSLPVVLCLALVKFATQIKRNFFIAFCLGKSGKVKNYASEVYWLAAPEQPSKPSSEMGERVSGHVRPIKNASMASFAHSRSNRLCFLLSLLVVFLVSGLR